MGSVKSSQTRLCLIIQFYIEDRFILWDSDFKNAFLSVTYRDCFIPDQERKNICADTFLEYRNMEDLQWKDNVMTY